MPIVAQLLVSLDDAVPQLVGQGARLLHVDQQAGWRQVFEQMRGPLEEQRQEILEAAGRVAEAHVAVHGVLSEIAGEAQAIAAAEFAHGVAMQRRLACRQQMNALQLVARALRIRIEMPDAVDVAIEHVDAIRRFGAHREHVEQRAANRELAVGDHLGDRRVAGHRQLSAQRVEVQRLPDMHLERIRLDVAARRQALHQRVDRDQPDASDAPAAARRALPGGPR